MADVRALLKAKRQEVRITHPYAAYGANGALRCTACGAAIKFASAWEGHLGSKAHRVAVAANLRAKEEKEKEEARRTAATAATTTTGAVSASKRKAKEGEDEDGEGEEEQMETTMAAGKKRQRTAEREIAPVIDGSSPDAPRSTGARMGTGAGVEFPADFFSDPSRAPPRGQDDADDEDVEMDQDAKAKAAAAPPPPPPPPKTQFDMEWDAFERDMQKKSLSTQQQQQQQQQSAEAAEADPQEMYARATIAAEPELVSRFEGLPVDGDGATAQEGTTTEQGTGAGGVEEGGRKVSEEELERRRKERDERELIMDRLVEEERQQEDAYGRVALMKNRIQILKQKRELAKAKGKKVAVDMET
jgi:zinc finger protein 830